MSLRLFSGSATLAVGLTTFSLAVACDEDGKTTPERCPELPLYDITRSVGGAPPSAEVGAGGDDGCVTRVGHAVSPSGGSPSSNGTGQGGADTELNAAAGADSNAGAGGA
jgi:hypothetical protein